jgi:hypothetical protein
MDKVDRKAPLRAWREQQRHAARARLPLPDPEMEALFDILDQRLSEVACDHTRRLTDAWLTSRGHAVDPVHLWLDETGGFCDCEVLMNSEEVWREATHGQ